MMNLLTPLFVLSSLMVGVLADSHIIKGTIERK